jgi:hypothetical protein
VAEFIFLLYGISALTRYSSPLKYLPLIVIGLGIIPAALTRDEGHVLRSILTLPGWQLLAALGVVSLRVSKLVRWLVGLLIVQAVVFLMAYFFWYPLIYARDWQYGLKEASAYLAEHESEYDAIVVSKWFGEPQLFLAFYNRWDPVWYADANKPNLEYERQGKLWLDQLEEYHLGKYTFKYIDFSQTITQKTLYIGKFDDFYENPQTLKTIYYPDGSVAVHIMEGVPK